MPPEIKQYEPAFKYGSQAAAAEVLGAGMSIGAVYGSTSVNTNGTTIVPLFPTGNKAIVAGTITNVNIVAKGTTAGTIVLVSDQGTLVTVIKNGTDGGGVGSVISPIAFQAGSLLTVVSLGADNANFEAVFYTYV